MTQQRSSEKFLITLQRCSCLFLGLMWLSSAGLSSGLALGQNSTKPRAAGSETPLTHSPEQTPIADPLPELAAEPAKQPVAEPVQPVATQSIPQAAPAAEIEPNSPVPAVAPPATPAVQVPQFSTVAAPEPSTQLPVPETTRPSTSAASLIQSSPVQPVPAVLPPEKSDHLTQSPQPETGKKSAQTEFSIPSRSAVQPLKPLTDKTPGEAPVNYKAAQEGLKQVATLSERKAEQLTTRFTTKLEASGVKLIQNLDGTKATITPLSGKPVVAGASQAASQSPAVAQEPQPAQPQWMSSAPAYQPQYLPNPPVFSYLSNGNAGLIFPLAVPAPITSGFGWRMHPLAGEWRFHSGTDLGAPEGTPVVAALTGRIVAAEYMGGYGLAIVIEHNQVTQQTLYGHLSQIFVRPGQIVEQGTVIGLVGSTGNSTGPHLHFEAQQWTPEGWTAVDAGGALEYALARLMGQPAVAQFPGQPMTLASAAPNLAINSPNYSGKELSGPQLPPPAATEGFSFRFDLGDR